MNTVSSRFVFDKRLLHADGTLHWRTYFDKRPPHATSVNLHDVVGKDIHWEEGFKIAPDRNMIGAADIENSKVEKIGLQICHDPVKDMPHHAELRGWRQGDDEESEQSRRDMAIDLALSSEFIFVPKN